MNILVASAPRSGTHFTINTLYENIMPFTDHEGVRYRNIPEDARESRIGTESGIYKTHHAYHQIIGTEVVKCKMIYVVRNPYDTLWSMYNYHSFENNMAMSFPVYLRYDPSDDPYFTRWGIRAEDMVEWLRKHRDSWRGVKGVLTISYEELSTAFEETVDKLADFLGMDSLEWYEYTRPTKKHSLKPMQGKVGCGMQHFTDEDMIFTKGRI